MGEGCSPGLVKLPLSTRRVVVLMEGQDGSWMPCDGLAGPLAQHDGERE